MRKLELMRPAAKVQYEPDTIIVIENGYIDNGWRTKVPRAASLGQISEMWNVTSAPVPNMGNITATVPMGCVVGGGSVVNGMFADRGSRADYDAWEALGSPGWGWDGLLPYFRKATSFTPPQVDLGVDVAADPSAYGRGPVHISFPSILFPDMRNMSDAVGAHGVSTSRGPASGDATGLVWTPNTLDYASGTRSHARVAYYDAVAAHRPNLRLVTGHVVDRILFDDDLNAVGVRVRSREDNSTETVSASAEVILAAGAVNTPKLLQLSGIGPRDVLEAAGVDVLRDAPGVGANFQDHPYLVTNWSLSNMAFPSLGDLSTNATYNASAWDEYLVNHTGPYSVAMRNSAIFLPLANFTSRSNSVLEELESDDSYAECLPAVYRESDELLKGYEAQRRLIISQYNSSRAAVAEIPVYAGGIDRGALVKPLSRGIIALDPADPYGNPIVQFNALSYPLDKKLFIELVRYIRDMYKEPLLAGYEPSEVMPGPQLQTDDEIMDALISADAVHPTFAHPSCTCAMMPEDLGGVVGPTLLVYGTGKLSVVDASIIPLVPATHLQSTVYAIAEKAADIIKARS